MIIETLPIADLAPADYNPRKDLKPGDPEYDKLKRSIETWGYVEPIIFNRRTKRVVGGHQRLKVLAEMGHTEAECVIVDLDETQEKLLNVALNKVGGEWDMPKLHDLFEEMARGGGYEFLTITGFDMAEIKDLMATPVAVHEDVNFDIDAATESAAKSTSVKPGQIYALGKHRLMCGDSTSKDDMAALMDGEKSDMVFTDPPYGVAIGTKNRTLKAVTGGGGITEDIAGDTLPPKELYAMLLAAFGNVRSHINDNCAVYVTAPIGGEIGYATQEMMRDAGLAVRHILIWVKNSATFSLGRLDYDYQHEPILFTWAKTHKRPMKGEHRTSVWQIDKPRQSKLHPTMKPIELVANALLNSSDRGDIVLDPFGGSGTTIVACEQTGRVCRTMELSPQYCQVILDRWVALTAGGKPELVRG